MPANLTTPRTRRVTFAVRTAIWEELADAFDQMASERQKEFTIEKLCGEIIESWAAERRILRAERCRP
jgi:hypothetical protein